MLQYMPIQASTHAAEIDSQVQLINPKAQRAPGSIDLMGAPPVGAMALDVL